MNNYLIFVRHGETDWNAAKRFQGGRSDVPLNPKGRIQARLIANVFLREHVAHLFCSPLQRALDTAEVIGRRLGLKAQVLEELRELDFGVYEGMLEGDLKERFGNQFLAWRQSQYTQAPPEGESIANARPRAEAALTKIAPRLADGCVIVCAHQAIIMAMKAVLADDYSVEAAQTYRQANNEVSYWEFAPAATREVRRITVSASLAGMIPTDG